MLIREIITEIEEKVKKTYAQGWTYDYKELEKTKNKTAKEQCELISEAQNKTNIYALKCIMEIACSVLGEHGMSGYRNIVFNNGLRRANDEIMIRLMFSGKRKNKDLWLKLDSCFDDIYADKGIEEEMLLYYRNRRKGKTCSPCGYEDYMRWSKNKAGIVFSGFNIEVKGVGLVKDPRKADILNRNFEDAVEGLLQHRNKCMEEEKKKEEQRKNTFKRLLKKYKLSDEDVLEFLEELEEIDLVCVNSYARGLMQRYLKEN